MKGDLTTSETNLNYSLVKSPFKKAIFRPVTPQILRVVRKLSVYYFVRRSPFLASFFSSLIQTNPSEIILDTTE